MNDEFYVGYSSQAPRRTALYVRRAVLAAAVLVTGVAILLVFAQQPFASSSFEYGQNRTFSGVIREHPFPAFQMDSGRMTLLVAPGKHGAGPLIAGRDGTHVDLMGQRIQRDGKMMVEMVPDSIRPSATAAPIVPAWSYAGEAELRGEIVDSKCYLGVMNPGEGKVHRDCAVRCISGGIPPALIAADAGGKRRMFLLTGPQGVAMNREILAFVGEPVIIRGQIFRSGEDWRIETLVPGIRRLE